MTDTSSNPTINHDTEARLELLAEQIEGLRAVISRFTEATGRFADGAVALLSGVPQTASSPQPTANGKRRGRKPGSKNRPKMAEPAPQVIEAPAEKPLHDIARKSLDLVLRNGFMTQADLARHLNVANSSIAHHTTRLVDDDMLKRIELNVGGRKEIAFLSPQRAVTMFKSEAK